jgi:hypothetical protein
MVSTHLFYSENAFVQNISLIQRNDKVVFMYFVDLHRLINEVSLLKDCEIFSFKEKKSLINAICDSLISKTEKVFYYY